MKIEKNLGCMVGTEDAVTFLESLPAMSKEDRIKNKTAEMYDRSLNRVRWLAYRVMPAPVKVYNPRGYREDYSCSACGAGASVIDKFCHNCGRELDWDHKIGDVKKGRKKNETN